METLSELREKMDSLSLQIAALLLQRRILADLILKVKSEMGLKACDLKREEELLALLIKGHGPQESCYLREIFKEILKQTRGSL